jgi:co-chaperonin GroES (HSP10)
MELHIKKIKPLFTNILVTGDKYEEDVKINGMITSQKGDLKLYQKVLEVGSMVRDVKVGDTVMFNPKDYAVMKYSENSIKNDMDMNKRIKWNLPWVTIYDEEGNSHDCLMLKDRDIEFVFEGEEVKDPEPQTTLIMPKPKKIITN